MEEENLITLASEAARVAATHKDAMTAFQAEEAARGALVRRIIQAVLPALPALSTRPVVGKRVWWPDNIRTAEEKDRADWKGICLDEGGAYGPDRDYPTANRGLYEGSATFLRSDGVVVKLTYTGRWSKWQGEAEEYTAYDAVVPDEEVCEDDAALATFTKRLTEAIGSYLDGKLGSRAEAARKRAERLTALASLL